MTNLNSPPCKLKDRFSPLRNSSAEIHIEPLTFDFTPRIVSSSFSIEEPIVKPAIRNGILISHQRTPSLAKTTFSSTNISSLLPIKDRPITENETQVSPSPLAGTVYHRRHRTQPVWIPLFTCEDDEFNTLISDPQIRFDPQKLNLIPSHIFKSAVEGGVSFGELVVSFFRSEESVNARFFHKLYNALAITSEDLFYVPYVGVQWITESAIKVDIPRFARLIGEHGDRLIGPHGRFATHGFIELNHTQALGQIRADLISDIDFESTRIFTHAGAVFVKNVSEDTLEHARWVSARRRYSGL